MLPICQLKVKVLIEGQKLSLKYSLILQADQCPYFSYFSYFFLLFDPESYFSLLFRKTALATIPTFWGAMLSNWIKNIKKSFYTDFQHKIFLLLIKSLSHYSNNVYFSTF